MSEGFFDFYDLRTDEKSVEDTVFAALDFETTGLNPLRDRVVEIGLLRFDIKQEKEAFDILVNPEIVIPSTAVSISGITNEMVKDQDTIKIHLDTILKLLANTVVIAHNINFDLSFLAAEVKRAGLTLPDIYGIDTQSFSKQVFPGQPSYSLQNLAAAMGFETGNAHRALDDARTCRSLFLNCLGKIPDFQNRTISEVIKTSKTVLEYN